MRGSAETAPSLRFSLGTSIPAAGVYWRPGRNGRSARRPRPARAAEPGRRPTLCHADDVPSCSHLDTITVTELPAEVPGCEDCLREGGVWLHLRICLECGHVGCCDDSPHKHAKKHALDEEHPLIRSLEPGEEWSWCFIDEVAMVIPEVQGSTRIPPSPMLS